MSRPIDRLRSVLLLSILGTMIVPDSTAQIPPELTSLIAAERAFARAAADSSMKQAFLAFLDDDGVVFRPEASNGKKTWSEAPDGSRALLSWDPVWAEVSRDGTLGYTTGPWTFSQTPEDSVVASGTYISVWKKDRTGEWKVMADLGIGHEQISDNSDVVETSIVIPMLPASMPRYERAKAAIHSLEVESSAAATSSSYERAMSRFVAPDSRFYRNGELPIIGRDAVLERLKRETRSVSWSVAGWDIAPSGDLAYTWGVYQTAADESRDAGRGNYLRVWRLPDTGEWTIALEVMSPLR